MAATIGSLSQTCSHRSRKAITPRRCAVAPDIMLRFDSSREFGVGSDRLSGGKSDLSSCNAALIVSSEQNTP
jgi:hypothetical protein